MMRLAEFGNVKHAISNANARLSYYKHMYFRLIDEHHEKLNEMKGNQQE